MMIRAIKSNCTGFSAVRKILSLYWRLNKCVVVSEHMVKKPTIRTGDWSVTKLNQYVDQLLPILLEQGLTKILWLHTSVIFATTIKKCVTLFN